MESISYYIKKSKSTFPVDFEVVIQDIFKYGKLFKAAKQKTWTYSLSPIYLSDPLPQVYYKGWIFFIAATTKTISWSITQKDIDDIRTQILDVFH